MRRPPDVHFSAVLGRKSSIRRRLLVVLASSLLVAGGATSAGAAELALPAVLSSSVGVDASVKASLAGFNPEILISDSQFYDANAMSSAQIQAFLDAKIGTCRTSTCINILSASFSSRDAVVSARTGRQVCAPIVGGTMLVSEAIFRLQVACSISAKVILVTLQKEQGLVTSRAPSDWNIRSAMGANCPDTAPCDPAYAGIGPQLVAGVTQLQTYRAGAFARQPGINFIGYHPNAACGGTNLNIRNYATAALYNYTPYQPNPAALAAGYGTGDGCSSYGNRNFVNYYTDWFESRPAPEITSLNESQHVAALTATGAVLGYPISADGRWGTPVTISTGVANLNRLISIGDFDGNGHRDLIGVDTSGRAWLLPGNGSISYGAPRQIAVDWTGAILITDAGDFDGDGIGDVLTTTASGSLLLWRGTGAGGFRAPKAIGQGWSTMGLISGGTDLTGDGAPDVLARDAGGTLRVYFGNGRGGWAGSAVIGSGWANMRLIFSPGDFNGDGRADLFASTNGGAMWLYAGSGAGTVANGVQIGVGWASMLSVVGSGPKITGARVFPAGAGDVNDDQAADVLARSGSDLLLYAGNGSGGWLATSVVGTGWSAGSRMVTLGDFTGDGVPDIARIEADGTFNLLRGDGAGGFASPTMIGNGWHTMQMIVGGIDFDGDRRVDVVARNSAGDLLLYRGDGAGSWAGAPTTIGNGWSIVDTLFYVGDFNGDRAPDMMARWTDGTLWLYPSSGHGTWLDARQVGNGWGGMTAIFGPGDFDRSGAPDVLARTAAGQLLLYKGDGRGGWASSSVVGWGWGGMAAIG